MPRIYLREPLAKRFWAKVNQDGGMPEYHSELGHCWTWKSVKVRGYGRMWLNGKYVQAHRAGYELLIGPIPDGLTLDHLCRNRCCVNPSHLEVVNLRENILRGEGVTAQAARRIHCPQGHPYDLFNTRFRKDGSRSCRSCSVIRGKQKEVTA